MWRRRPPALAASKEPARLYTYHKLHAWDPRVVKGAPRVAFVDADAIYVRNASALLEIEPPSAFYLRDACRPPNIPWHRWDPGIEIDGEPVPKARAYWNTGVVVYEPDATVARDLWRLYATGDFASFDPSRMSTGNGVGRLGSERALTDAGLDPDQYVCEGDLLQTYYWRRWRGSRPHVLNAAWNFRGYKCSYADVADASRVRVVHKEERRAITLIFDACEHVRAPPRGARPRFLEELVSALDVGACRSPAAAAALRRTCPDQAQGGVG